MIEGAKCECGKTLVPFRTTCPKCGKEMTRTEFEEKGNVLTHTTLYATPKGIEIPINLAMVELDGGANLVCGYDGEENLKIGDKVKIKMKEDLFFCEL